MVTIGNKIAIFHIKRKLIFNFSSKRRNRKQQWIPVWDMVEMEKSYKDCSQPEPSEGRDKKVPGLQQNSYWQKKKKMVNTSSNFNIYDIVKDTWTSWKLLRHSLRPDRCWQLPYMNTCNIRSFKKRFLFFVWSKWRTLCKQGYHPGPSTLLPQEYFCLVLMKLYTCQNLGLGYSFLFLWETFLEYFRVSLIKCLSITQIWFLGI